LPVRVFGQTKPLIGVVHLPPLPGAPRHRGTMRALVERALRDARAYLDQGMDGLIIENYGDAPFHRDRVSPETIAAMAVVARDVRALGRFPLGIQVLRNDAGAALGIAVAAGADFVRVNVLAGAMVTDQGVIEGCAADLLRRRAALRARVAIWADLLVKHAAPLAPVDPAAAARDLRERALADALIVTGPRTGAAVDLEALRQLRRAAPGGPWIAGSGVRADTLADIWDLADGFIVGSSLEERGRAGSPVVPARVRDLVHARRRLLPARS
jgi:membrane complex biogenesis BtpA family protein